MQAQPSELRFLWVSNLKVQIASPSIRRKKCTYSHVIRINKMLKCDSKYMLGVDVGVWGLKDPPYFQTLFYINFIENNC